MRSRRVPAMVLAAALCAGAAAAATYQGGRVDGRWYDGRIVNADFGAYDCQVRFRDDHAMVRLSGSNRQLECFLEEEAIADPHRITVYDPSRGVYWTLNVFNLGS